MTSRTKNAPADSPAGLLATTYRVSPRTTEVEALAAIQKLKAGIEEQEHQLVFELRHRGGSWQDIADSTGMNSRQAAQKRYEKSAGLVDLLDQTAGRPERP